MSEDEGQADEPVVGDGGAPRYKVGDPGPDVNVVCFQSPLCSEAGQVKTVQSGTVVGDDVMVCGTFSCMVCGQPMELVHE